MTEQESSPEDDPVLVHIEMLRNLGYSEAEVDESLAELGWERSRKSAQLRRQILDTVIANEVNGSRKRLESRSDFDAMLVRGSKVDHGFHFRLILFSLLLWAGPYLWYLIFRAVFRLNERHFGIRVDEFGEVHHTKMVY